MQFKRPPLLEVRISITDHLYMSCSSPYLEIYRCCAIFLNDVEMNNMVDSLLPTLQGIYNSLKSSGVASKIKIESRIKRISSTSNVNAQVFNDVHFCYG